MIYQQKPDSKLAFYSQLLCFLFLILFSNSTFGQSEKTLLKARKGIALTNSGKILRFRKVRETENSFIFLTTNKTEIELEKFKITKINKRRGTKGFKYAMTAIGGTFLVVINSYYIADFYSLSRSRSFYEGEIVIVSVLLSTLTGTVGGLIGLTQKRYKTIYSSSNYGNYKPKLELKTTSPNTIPSLTISYTF